ncbi:MAG: hypothetical protein ABID54_07310 [Pseudomonadota bacterium]
MVESSSKDAKKKEIIEENKKIRYLRFIVDFSISYIQQSQITLDEAIGVVEGVRKQALALFPGKGDAFDIIYRPRFKRIINEKFQVH